MESFKRNKRKIINSISLLKLLLLRLANSVMFKQEKFTIIESKGNYRGP